MKVRDLVRALKACPQDANVEINVERHGEIFSDVAAPFLFDDQLVIIACNLED